MPHFEHTLIDGLCFGWCQSQAREAPQQETAARLAVEDLGEQVEEIRDHVEEWREHIIDLQEDRAMSTMDERMAWLQRIGALPESEPDDDSDAEEGGGVGLEGVGARQAGGATGGWTGEWTVKKCEVGAGGGAMAAAV